MKSSPRSNPSTQAASRPASGRLPGLDTLRSLAILTVIAFHILDLHAANTIPGALLPIVRTCWMGVDLFFVLSGYLIGSQLLRPYAQGRRPSILTFYLKRFFRILPVYAVVLSLYLAWPLWRESPHMAPPWEFFTFTENFFVHYSTERAFSHAWSLCVEEHFYLLLPLITLLLARKPSIRRTVTVLTGFFLFGVAFRAFVLFHWLQPMAQKDASWLIVYVKQIYYPTYSRLDGLLAGVALALLRTFRPAWWQLFAQRGHALLLAGAALIAAAIYLSNDRFQSVTGAAAFGVVFAFPILSLGIALVTASALSHNGLLARLHIPGARAVATLAFTLYLSHKGILHLTTVFFPQISASGGLPWIALFLACAFAAAALLYFAVERPFMLLRDRLLHQRKPHPEEELRAEPAL
ncbi:MAG TPA: acyltransferase [Acidobacteriaceae bacterium]|nr:acyltransferase [Acidobacteriaceae bacterium]